MKEASISDLQNDKIGVSEKMFQYLNTESDVCQHFLFFYKKTLYNVQSLLTHTHSAMTKSNQISVDVLNE